MLRGAHVTEPPVSRGGRLLWGRSHLLLLNPPPIGAVAEAAGLPNPLSTRELLTWRQTNPSHLVLQGATRPRFSISQGRKARSPRSRTISAFFCASTTRARTLSA